MLTKLGRDEVIMALHKGLGFSTKFAQRWIQVVVMVIYLLYCLCITDALEYGVPKCANWIKNWRLQLGKRVNYITGNQLHWLNMKPNRLHRFRMHTWQMAHLIGQLGAFSPKDFFFRSECNSNKLNASPYPDLKYRDCCCSDWFHKYGSHAFWFAKKSNF